MAGLHRRDWILLVFSAYLLVWDTLQIYAAEQKGVISGTPTANVRAGAGAEHPIKAALNEGDAVIIDKLEGEWYSVTLADGQKGYVHRNLVKVAEDAPTAAKTKATEPATSTTQTIESPPAKVAVPPLKQDATPTREPAAERQDAKSAKSSDGKAPSILQMIEAHNTEVKIALLVATVAFFLGWFCGGHYYLWRERKRQRRLRF
jgi:uncharacterized protein YgiM (DUF1202 family)